MFLFNPFNYLFMLGIFRKSVPTKENHSFGDFMAYELQPCSKVVKDGDVCKTVVSFTRVPLSAKTKNADIPSPENYELRAQLKQGFVPQEVNVRGLLDTDNELDSDAMRTLEVATARFNKEVSNVEPKNV